MKRIAQIILGVVILGLVYVIYDQISTPIRFEDEVKVRNAQVIERIKDIRTAQRSFKSKYQRFTGSFDTLISFVLNDTLELERKIVDEDDSVELRYIPGTDKKAQYIMEAGIITTESKVVIPVVECRAPYKMYLDTVEFRQDIINLIDNDVHNLQRYPGIKFGSMETGNNEAGNWE